MNQTAQFASIFLRWSSVLGNLSELCGFLIIAGATIFNGPRHKEAEDLDDRASAMEHAAKQSLLHVDRTEGALRRQDSSGNVLEKARLAAVRAADTHDAKARERRSSARDIRFLAWQLDKRAFYISFGFIVAGALLQMVGSIPS